MCADYLPIPTSPQQSDPWVSFLNQTPASSGDLNQYRFGTYHAHSMDPQRPIPVPHPQNHSYSSIETAKRKQATENMWWQRKRTQLHHRDIQQQKWIRPMSESAFQIHRPNIHNWNNILKRGY